MGWLQSVLRRLRKFRNTRLYPRFPAGDADIQILPKDGGPAVRTKVADWSPGGLFVLTKETIPLETRVDLELRVRGPSGPQTIQLEGQVVRHHRNETTGEPEGMGVMFTNFTQPGLKTLQELLMGG